MKIRNCHSGALLLSLCMGLTVSSQLQASTVDYHEHLKATKASKACCNEDIETPEDWFSKGLHKGFKHRNDVDLTEFPGRGEAKKHWHEGRINWHDHDGRSNRDHLEHIGNGNHAGIGKHCDIEPAAVVPVPAAAWLLGSGLLGLVGLARRRAA